MQLRAMEHADISEVNRVNRDAFRALLKREKHVAFVAALLRPNALWDMYRTAGQDRCFVATAGKRIVGYAITHLWGTVGWFGPLGVAPDWQRQGVGKDLALMSVDSLERNGATTIGLETMPDSVSNLGFYSRLGFQSNAMSFVLAKSVLNSEYELAEPLMYQTDFSSTHKEAIIDECGELTGKILPGLDYSGEIHQTDKYKFGTTLFFRHDDKLIGFAVCHSGKYFRSERAETLRVKIAVAHPAAGRNQVDRLIAGIEAFARQSGKYRLHMNINARHDSWYRLLLERGYRLVATGLRMTWDGYEEEISSDAPDFNRWVG